MEKEKFIPFKSYVGGEISKISEVQSAATELSSCGGYQTARAGLDTVVTLSIPDDEGWGCPAVIFGVGVTAVKSADKNLYVSLLDRFGGFVSEEMYYVPTPDGASKNMVREFVEKAVSFEGILGNDAAAASATEIVAEPMPDPGRKGILVDPDDGKLRRHSAGSSEN